MENWKFALSSIMSHKMRSFLTMLGIIIGVAAVTIIVALGDGMKATLQDIYKDQRQNAVLYYNPKTETDKVMAPVVIQPEWLPKLKEIDGVKDYYATNNASANMEVQGKQAHNVLIQGIDDHFFNNNKLELITGRLFNQQDYHQFGRTILINDHLAENLFDKEVKHALNQIIFVNGNPYRVVGVYKTMAVTKFISEYLPKETAIMTNQQVAADFGTDLIMNVNISVNDILKVNGIAKAAAKRLTKISGVTEGEFESQDYTMIENQMNQQLNQTTTIIGAIGGISLFVGGIGVMNIMLVSVTERTREIGLRKALGATRRKILIQFLIESAVLTLIGGLIGILFAESLVQLINLVYGEYIHASVSLSVGITGLIFSAITGIVFGLLPANRASKLNPIEALRYE